MKKINYIFLLSIVSLASCSKYLDTEPVSNGIAVETNSSTVAFKNASELEAALAGAYGDFKNEYYQLDYFVNGDAQSDDAYAGGDNPANFQIDNLKLDATNSNVSRDWRYLYATIGKCNKVINNVDSVIDATLTSTRKNEIKGEASFIRAFMYFQLVQLWGDVPLILLDVQTISAEKLPELYPILFPARNTKDEVYKQINSDLKFALANVKATNIHKGYATTGAVNVMLAKVAAAQSNPDWANVKKYCDDVISGGYSLLPDYNSLWDNANENSAESIFEINYSGGSSDGNWGVTIFRGLDWKKFNLPSNDLVRAFDDEKDAIRKAASVIFLDVSGKWSDQHWTQKVYPFINKYHKFTSGSDQNYIFFRLADVLLLKAEALNELGDLAGAKTLVNQIRTRVKLPNTTANSQAEMRLAIEKERRLELAFEGHRWYDLKRTNRAIDVMNNAKDENNVSLGYTLNTNRLLWPIPQAELDKNQKLKQNPGY